MIYGFTGPERPLSPTEIDHVRDVVYALPAVTGIVTGGARGVDALVARVALQAFPHAEHRLVLPQGYRYDRHLQAELPDHVVREWVGGGFMARNDRLVLRTGTLVAFPDTPGETIRSGTWATVRRARKRGIPIRVHPFSDALLGAAR